MTDHDPTRGGESSGEYGKVVREELVRALGTTARLSDRIQELQQLGQNSVVEASRLRQELDRVEHDRRQFNVLIGEAGELYHEATLDTVQKLAEVLDTYAMPIEEAVQLISETLGGLDEKVLQNVVDDRWGIQQVPAVEAIDYTVLTQKAQAIRDLPAGDFVGMSKNRELLVGRPEGQARLRLVEGDGRGTKPFPYTATVEIEIARSEDPQPGEPKAFAGDILIGADAIIDRVVAGNRHFDYLTSEGKPYMAETLLETFRDHQTILQGIMMHDGLLEYASPEHARKVTQSIDKSNAGFRAVVGQQAASIYSIEKNREAYTKTLADVYLDRKDYRKTIALIDTIYGDGRSESGVKLAAYTQILAVLFETDGKLSDVAVTDLDMRQAMYYLTLEKTQQQG